MKKLLWEACMFLSNLLLHVKILGSKEFLDILERSCQIYTKRTHAWRLEHLFGFLIISQICPGLRSLVKIHEDDIVPFFLRFLNILCWGYAT